LRSARAIGEAPALGAIREDSKLEAAPIGEFDEWFALDTNEHTNNFVGYQYASPDGFGRLNAAKSLLSSVFRTFLDGYGMSLVR
jgi:hypothetical protein